MRGAVSRAVLMLLALLAALVACSGNDFCGERREVLLRSDGGSYPCLMSADCPRPANALVCMYDNPPLTKECVRCEQPPGADGGAVSVCVDVIPELCH